ncbi:bile acid:Na+ symporter, BASS family [Maridesulfovibrio ferrireducens]|uniref:Bile acid:Na+ symporter, BASS family n=1 Tax=Maridesulfovibrio ferrireducens TaxID=246191 RepID=A0A1G9KC01_9BACT|nr:bile acid:sodium symporter family protein [Maridesulfovibrio ferrireducens]SDL47328.1 bile acid:Na+ symporter, BASS family [Maridesulfovibrio ferrireducens]
MINSICRLIERHFLLLAMALSAAAYIEPTLFTWLKPHIALCLGIIMFGMGLTLEVKDFASAIRNYKAVGLGVALQYAVMPILAVTLSSLLGLPQEAVIGMVVVGACPGGTASNVIAHLAKANVALSVTMTLISTCLSPILTPAIIYLVLNQQIEIPFLPMVESVFWIVVFPLVDGLVFRKLFRKKIDPIIHIFPSLSILVIALLIACIIGLNHDMLATFPVLVFVAVVLHNLGGLAAGYWGGRITGLSHQDSLTLAIEVGMQNSGLGVALATKYFGAASALPGALFSLWHNISGVYLANRNRKVSDK